MLTALCGIGGLAPSALAQTLSDGIAAIINEEVITISELQAAMTDETIRLKARYEGNALKERLVHKQYGVLNQMIERTLKLQEARAKGIAVTDEEVETALERLRENPAALPASVSRSTESIREELSLRRVTELEIRGGIIVPFEEIRAYYNDRQRLFTAPREYRLRQILLLPKPEESAETVKERAGGLVSQLQEGATFAELAQRVSDGPAGVKGGDLGFVRKEDLLAPLKVALDTLKPGEYSPALETEIGIHLLLLEETREGTPQPFDDVKDFIHDRLYQKKLRQAHGEWLASLKDKSYISIRF